MSEIRGSRLEVRGFKGLQVILLHYSAVALVGFVGELGRPPKSFQMCRAFVPWCARALVRKVSKSRYQGVKVSG